MGNKHNLGGEAPNAVYLEIGTRYGRRVIIGGPEVHNEKRYYLTRCDCGTERWVAVSILKRGLYQSCGCLTAETSGTRNRTHAESKSKLYATWFRMKSRCYYEKNPDYRYYGGRGISVCDAWRESYEPFAEWARTNGYAEGLVIDRIDNDGKYCPENCRWVNRKVSAANRRCCRMVTLFGETKNLTYWFDDPRCIGNSRVFYERTKQGWSVEEALLTPSGRKRAS